MKGSEGGKLHVNSKQSSQCIICNYTCCCLIYLLHLDLFPDYQAALVA